jgi:hypothetical protein
MPPSLTGARDDLRSFQSFPAAGAAAGGPPRRVGAFPAALVEPFGEQPTFDGFEPWRLRMFHRDQ